LIHWGRPDDANCPAFFNFIQKKEMILLPQLFDHAQIDLKNAIYVVHYGLGRHYKIQAVKPKEGMQYYDMAMQGDAIMFTIQQMYGSMHLRTNNDITQVFGWFYERTDKIEIQTVEQDKYHIFVLMKRQEKPIEIVSVKEPEVEMEVQEQEETTENEEGI
jgi:hypothetical protein